MMALIPLVMGQVPVELGRNSLVQAVTEKGNV